LQRQRNNLAEEINLEELKKLLEKENKKIELPTPDLKLQEQEEQEHEPEELAQQLPDAKINIPPITPTEECSLDDKSSGIEIFLKSVQFDVAELLSMVMLARDEILKSKNKNNGGNYYG